MYALYATILVNSQPYAYLSIIIIFSLNLTNYCPSHILQYFMIFGSKMSKKYPKAEYRLFMKSISAPVAGDKSFYSRLFTTSKL